MAPVEIEMRHRALDVPLAAPFRIAYDTITHAHNVLVTAHGDHVGFGEAAPQPSITGEDQAKVLADLGQSRTTLAARTALDMARVDLAAREADQPLSTFLGGPAPAPAPTSITIPLVPEEELQPLVERRLEEGFRIFKAKAGLAVAEDLHRLGIIRGAIGDLELRVDANQGWQLDDAAAALGPLADLNVAVLEQPLAKADLAGHATLTTRAHAEGGPPIMLDESVFSVADAKRALEAKACDQINIKLQKCGGPTEALRIADLAATAGVPCMVGCMLETRIGMLHAAHVVHAHPNIRMADVDGAVLLRDDPVQGGGTYVDGALELVDAPGIGVEAA